MNHYFLLLDARLFHDRLHPALAASWRQRSFAPCRPLCEELLPAVQRFTERYHVGAAEPLLCQVARGLPFHREFWTLLAGELFLHAAAEIPEIEAAPDTLCCLLAREQYLAQATAREQLAPIQQAHQGSRDLVFGGKLYRPEHAGWNDLPDVARLAEYLETVECARWTVADLEPLRDVTDEADRADELEYVREWFPALQNLYRSAQGRGYVVLCEQITASWVY